MQGHVNASDQSVLFRRVVRPIIVASSLSIHLVDDAIGYRINHRFASYVVIGESSGDSNNTPADLETMNLRAWPSEGPLFILVLGILLSLCKTTNAFVGQRSMVERPARSSLDVRNEPHEEEKEAPKIFQNSNAMSRSRFLKTVAVAPFLVSGAATAASTTTTTTQPAVSTAAATTASNTAHWLAEGRAATTTATTTLEESISGFLAGAALATTKTIVKYPLDTATVRLQMPGTTYSIARFGELMDGCYRGITTPLLTNTPAGAVFFAVKDATKTSLKASMPDMPRWQRTCLAVAAAQIPYWWIRNPSEVIKTRQQANIPGYVNTTAIQAFQQVGADAAADNVTAFSAFYSGFWENILYAYPADVIKFVVYDRFAGSAERLSPSQGAVAGAFSTAVAQLVTTPLDVVRNRVMAKNKKSETLIDEPPPPSSYIDTLVEIGRTEGLSGLLAGATPRVGKAVLSGAIQFATYEETKQELANLFAGRRVPPK
eukprot:scaffold2476_cov193-Amphora_coffeaeformis.AAC.2